MPLHENIVNFILLGVISVLLIALFAFVGLLWLYVQRYMKACNNCPVRKKFQARMVGKSTTKIISNRHRRSPSDEYDLDDWTTKRK